MAQPMYITADILATDRDTNGQWKGLWAQSAGNVKVDMFGSTGEGVTFTLTASQLLPVKVTKIYGSGSTITTGNLYGLN